MGDHPFRVTLENGLHSPAELLQGPQSRRRMSLGSAPPDEEGRLRDGEEEVDEYQELVRCGNNTVPSPIVFKVCTNTSCAGNRSI